MATLGDWYTVLDPTTDRGRKRARLSTTPPPVQPLATSNQFEPLDGLRDDTGDSPENMPIAPPNSPATASDMQIDTQTPSTDTLPKAKIPPIVIAGILDHAKLINMIKTNTIDHSFFLVSRGDTIRLQLKTRQDYTSITDILKKESFTFHTYSTDELKLVKYVIRGLPIHCKPDFIKEELTLLNIPVEKVTQLTAPTADKTPMPLFAFTMLKSQPREHILKIKTIFYTRVTIEQFRGQRGPIQCFKCQRFGHTNHFCNNTTRCFKCAGFHSGRECTKARDIPCKCVNCGEAHPASYRRCEVFLRANTNNAAPRHAVLSQPPPTFEQPRRPPSDRRPGLLYSSATSGENVPPPPPPIPPHIPYPRQGGMDIWTTVALISNAISQTSGVPPTIKLLLQLLVDLVNTQNPNLNGSQP